MPLAGRWIAAALAAGIGLVLSLSCSPRPQDATRIVRDQPDDAGLSINERGERPPSVPDGVELEAVRLERRDGRLGVAFDSVTPIPRVPYMDNPLKGPGWFLRVWSEGNSGSWVIGIVPDSDGDRSGGGFKVLVCEGSELCDREAEGARLEIRDDVIEMAIRVSEIPVLAGDFTWVGQSFWTEVVGQDFGWGDDVPDHRRSADKTVVPESDRASFP